MQNQHSAGHNRNLKHKNPQFEVFYRFFVGIMGENGYCDEIPTIARLQVTCVLVRLHFLLLFWAAFSNEFAIIK